MIRSLSLSMVLLSILAASMVMGTVISRDERMITATPSPSAIPGSLPDLNVKISTIPRFEDCSAPVATLNIRVSNVGGSDAGVFTVRINGVNIIMEGLEAGESLLFSYDHSVLSPELDLKAEVDVKNTVVEADERNNYDAWILSDDRLNRDYVLYCTPTPSSARPDLTIRVRYNDDDECGSARVIEKLIVENLGVMDAGPFTVEVNGVDVSVPGVEAHNSVEILLRELNMVTLTVSVDVDVNQEIWESNEENNYQMWMPSTVGAYWEYFVYCTPTP